MTPEQFLVLADPLPEPTLLVAGDGVVLAGNRAVEERLGVSLGRVVGQRLAAVMADDAAEVQRYVRACSRSRQLVLGALTVCADDGRRIGCRSEGVLLRPKSDTEDALVMLRLGRKEEAIEQFAELNARIADLGEEVRRRTEAESLQATQHDILEMVARDVPLFEVLAAICRGIEAHEPGLLCSVLLAGEGESHSGKAIGPSLPHEIVDALSGADWAEPYVGSCLAALEWGHDVVVADIEHDVRWSPRWRELNLRHGIRACRSIAIVGSEGRMLASVTVYRKRPGDQGPAHGQLLEVATHLAGIAIERDAARRREARLNLATAAADARFRAFFEQGALFAGIMGTDGILVEANRLSLEACGYRREEVVGKWFWECPWWSRSAQLAERIRKHVARAAGGETIREELPYYVANGGERIVDFILRPIMDESGRVMFLAPTGTDITDRKRAEAELRRSEIRERMRADELEAVMEAVPAVVWIAHDPECRRITGNATSEALMGVPQGTNQSLTAVERELPTNFRVMKDGVELSAQELPVQLAATGVAVRDFEEEIVFDDGRRLHLFGHAMPLRDERGELRGSVAAFVDITERKLAEDANATLIETLKLEDKHKNEFLATLAHELRNPLAPLQNGLELMKLGRNKEEIVEDARAMMERQLGQMVRLIDDLLDVSRISRGKVELRRERIPVAKVVQQAVETSAPLIEQFGHELEVSMPAGAIFVEADATRMAQVFANLLNNAAKYSECGGRIFLGVERDGEDVVVTVRDTGVGIPAEMLPRVFDMFTQVDRSLERSRGGLGIGLSLVKGLVEKHGGRVEARSGGVGAGSEFVVRLPVALSVVDGAADEPPPEATKVTHRRRILVVDDSVDGAQSLALMLKLLGNETRTANDGLEALDVAAAFRPDVVLLDIGMPRLNGYDTAARIRGQSWGKSIAVVALTGWGQAEDRRRSLEVGFDAHLVKPVEPKSLLELLAQLQANAVG